MHHTVQIALFMHSNSTAKVFCINATTVFDVWNLLKEVLLNFFTNSVHIYVVTVPQLIFLFVFDCVFSISITMMLIVRWT